MRSDTVPEGVDMLLNTTATYSEASLGIVVVVAVKRMKMI